MKFIADEMLGKLARWLRMGGLDVEAGDRIEDAQLLARAEAEGRIILTRDTRLIRKLFPEKFLFISFDHLEEQMEEFFSAYPSLLKDLHPLSRCVECNSPIIPIPKQEVAGKVWPFVYETQENFTTCPRCGKIYWEATHVAKIKEKLSRLLSSSAHSKE